MMIDEKTWARIQTTFATRDKRAVEDSVYGVGYTNASEKAYFIDTTVLQPQLAEKVLAITSEV